MRWLSSLHPTLPPTLPHTLPRCEAVDSPCHTLVCSKGVIRGICHNCFPWRHGRHGRHPSVFFAVMIATTCGLNLQYQKEMKERRTKSSKAFTAWCGYKRPQNYQVISSHTSSCNGFADDGSLSRSSLEKRMTPEQAGNLAKTWTNQVVETDRRSASSILGRY